MHLLFPFLPTASDNSRYAPREDFLWYIVEAQKLTQLAGSDPDTLELTFRRVESGGDRIRYVDYLLEEARATLASGTTVDLKPIVTKRLEEAEGRHAFDDLPYFAKALLYERPNVNAPSLNNFFELFGRNPGRTRSKITLHVDPNKTLLNLPAPNPERGFLDLGPMGLAPWKDYARAWHALSNAARVVAGGYGVRVEVEIEGDPSDPDNTCRYAHLRGWFALDEGEDGETLEVDLIEKVRAEPERFAAKAGLWSFIEPGFWYNHALREDDEFGEAERSLLYVTRLLTPYPSCNRWVSFEIRYGQPPEVVAHNIKRQRPRG
ncbi:hypothetical protein [Oceanithermus sp.]|uniref:hypothetical protein n=1 Tax=Oceanithermus sp. TaxID=2268145 RepID=UPI00257B70BA|nr:hypothetical protein [Oceanithermus sp.]